MTEAQLRQRWIKKYARPEGLWVRSIGASMFGSGVADLLVGYPREPHDDDFFVEEAHLVFVEAKKTLPLKQSVRTAFRPSQMTAAQRDFLDAVVRYGGRASVLVLDDEGWLLMEWERARLGAYSRAEFACERTPW